MKNETKATLYASVAVLSWSTVATAFKITLMHFTHFEMLLVASSTALLIFSLLITVRKDWKAIAVLPARQWALFAFLGLLNPVAYYLVLFKAYTLLPAQVAQPINYAWPIILLVLLALFAHQPIPPRKYIGMFFSLGGVALISMGSGNISNAGISTSGLLLATLSALLWASYWMINNRLKEKADNLTVLFVGFLSGTLFLAVSCFWTDVHLDSLPGILSSIYVGAFEISIPFICFGIAMRKTSNPALINQLCYLSPFLSLFFVATVLHEKIVTSTYVGLILIVSGIVFNQCIEAKKTRR